MSSILSRVNIISQSQHDEEVKNPTFELPDSKPKKTYLQALMQQSRKNQNKADTSAAAL